MVKPKFEERVAEIPQIGGHLDLIFENEEDVARQQREFLPSSGLFVRTKGKPKPFSEFEIKLFLPDGQACPPLQARLVQIAEVGPEQGLMLQLLDLTSKFNEQIDEFMRKTQSTSPECGPTVSSKNPAAEKPDEKNQASDERGRPLRLTLQQKLRQMNPMQRAMHAAKADKMTRSVLIRDHEPQVIMFLLKNPRLTRQEVFEISRVNAINAQVAEMICANKQWIQHEDIRFNLVMNPKSPLPLVMRLLKSLNMKHLRELAKNHNIKTQIKRTALRMVVERNP